MQKEHTDEWFEKQDLKLEEPFKNTKRYYYKRALLYGLSIVGIPKGLYLFFSVRHYINVYNAQTADYMFKGRMIKNVGPPGCGKTFVGTNIAYNLALQRWEELKVAYFTARTMVKQWIKNGDADKLIAYEALKESYEYFAEREAEFIPCLVTTIPLREYGTGRMSYVLTPAVYAMAQRIPEYTVLLNDETGATFSCHNSINIAEDVQDFMRFIRQMLDAVGINTEQGDDGDAKTFRKSTDYNNYLGGQEWLMRPKGLEKRLNRKINKYFKRLYEGKLTEEQADYIGQKLYYLKEYKKTIGFRRIPHELKAAGASLFGGVQEDYIFPAIGAVQYNDRAFRGAYKCKDEPIELEGWKSLLIEDCDLHAYDELTRKQSKQDESKGGNAA